MARRSRARNSVDATTVSTVLQAGTMRGGIHFHTAAPVPPVIPRQLPAPPRWFAARTGEMTRLDHALGETPDAAQVLVIEGPGGVGKTALALHWLHHNLDQFPDGQLHADLHGFDRNCTPAAPATVVHGFLLGLGVPPDAIPADASARIACYRSMTAGKRLVVVLDNTADASQVAPLLPGSPACRAVVTSRSRLPALSLHGAETLHLDVLPDDKAREMLVRHLGSYRVGEEPEAVTAILRRCAGLPLALSIVAALADTHGGFPLSTIADELREAALDTFDAGDPAADLRTVLSCSVCTLDSAELRMFGLLGVAPTLPVSAAAAAALAALPVPRATALLRELERKNLLQHPEPGRFGMHELVRLYAREHAPPSDDALTRLADFYLHSALAADHLLYPHRTPVATPPPPAGCVPLTFADPTAAMAWFTTEHEQLLGIQGVLADHERQWLLSRALDTYLYRRGHIVENVTSSRLGVAAAEHLGTPALTLALRQAGRAHTRAGELPGAIESLRRALELEDNPHTHFDLARPLADSGDFASAADHLRLALEGYRSAGNQVGEAHALNALGRCHGELGNSERAVSCCESALALHERHENRGGQVGALDNLGTIALRAGRPADAIARHTKALTMCEELGDTYLEARILEHLAEALEQHGDAERAAAACQAALELFTSQQRAADVERILTSGAGPRSPGSPS